jgi:hypothetical protein
VRRIALATTTIALAGGLVAPAFTTASVVAGPPPLPVGVSGHGNNGVCVWISEQVPQCVDLGQIGTTSR